MQIDRVSLDIERRSLVASALRLSYFTIAWNGVVGAIALVVGLTIGSIALAGFALNALLDSSASIVLVWRFRKERDDPVAAERLEQRAQTWIILAMLVVAAYVGGEAFRALLDGSHPGSSPFALAIATVSLLVLPLLGLRSSGLRHALEARLCMAMAYSRSPLRHSPRSRCWRSSPPPLSVGGGPIRSLRSLLQAPSEPKPHEWRYGTVSARRAITLAAGG